MRERAATDFATNLIVLAGAGTGKTSLLVERILVAVGSGRATLHQLAAITFTEKAAGEMHERLALGLARLHERATEQVEDAPEEAADRAFAHLVRLGHAPEEVAACALAAFDALPGAAITTIHGFCVHVLRAFPRQAGLPPGFAVDAVGEGIEVFDDAWAEFLERELGPDGSRAPEWDALLAEMPLATVKTIARGLAEPTVPEQLLEGPYVPADAAALFGAEARSAAAAARAQGTALGVRLAEGCEALAEGGLPGVRAYFDGNPDLDAVFERGVAAELKPARSLLKDLLPVDETGFAATHTRVARFAAEVRRERRARGLVGFDELLAATARLLRGHPEVRESLRARYRMLLVDEFQDTDPLQYEIVLFLGERAGGRASDAYAAEMEPGRLFLVGDPKQSIYRFRGADYAALARVLARLTACGAEVLHLEENWRSVEEVLAPVHAVFEDGPAAYWKAEEGYQPPYHAVRAARGRGGRGPGVELWSVGGPRPGPLSAEARRRAEGRVLAREIVNGVQGGRFALRDVTVLLRAFTYLRDYLRPLREAGIPFVVSGGREFLVRPEIVGTLAVLRAVAHAGDPTALLAYLRSPAGGVPDDELAEFAAEGGGWHVGQKPDGRRFPTLAAALHRLRRLQEQTRALPPDAVVRRVMDAAGLSTLHACAFEGAQRVANLRKLASTAAELGRDGRLSLLEILDAIEDKRGSDPEGESPLADEGMNAVRILTIHVAKGLEGKIVFVPDLAGGRGSFERPAIEPGVGVARFPERPALALRAKRRFGVAAAWQQREERKHDEAEEARILYVALTRARERLVVLCGACKNPGRWVSALESWGYAAGEPADDGALLGEGRVLHRRVTDEDGSLPALHAREAKPDRARLDLAAVHAAAVPPLSVPSALREERSTGLEVDEGGPGLLERSVARAVGTAVHRVLERWPDAAAPRHQSAAARAAASAVGADPRAVERETAAILSAFARSPLAARLAGLDVLGREVPLLLADGPTAWRGTLDLLYREEGEVVVADYKTDKEVPEEALRAHYGPQLDIYARAVMRALDLPRLPRREIWLLRAGRVLPCP